MPLNIQERSQKLQCLCQKSQQSLRTIAAATGIPKSSVHRHLRNIKQRQSYAESHLWETKEGGDWLRLLVFAVIYCFGIKGIFRKSISIFRLLHLEERIMFASALRELEVQLKEQIIAYGQAQAEASHGEQPIGIWVVVMKPFMACPRGHGISQWIYLQ